MPLNETPVGGIDAQAHPRPAPSYFLLFLFILQYSWLLLSI